MLRIVLEARSTVCRTASSKLSEDRPDSSMNFTTEHDAETKRRLRLELAGQAGGEIIAAEISKRLTSLKSARSFVDWHKRRDFVKALDLQRTMIVDQLAPTRPD